MNNYANQIFGGVGGAAVHPRYVGSAEVRPRYVGAPAQMVQAPDRPVDYSQIVYTAGDVSYFGMGTIIIPAGVQVTTPALLPQRPITPQRLGLPSDVQGLLINAASIGGINLFASQLGIPVQMFSEVSTFPQIDWPTLEPATGIAWTVTNPTGVDLPFSPTFYGTTVRR